MRQERQREVTDPISHGQVVVQPFSPASVRQEPLNSDMGWDLALEMRLLCALFI